MTEFQIMSKVRKIFREQYERDHPEELIKEPEPANEEHIIDEECYE